MTGKLYKYFAGDHRRLDDLLDRATAKPDAIDMELYGKFRLGLLRHISMEEKILFPAAQRYNGGEPLAVTAKLRLDHGAIAALLVSPPSRTIIAALRAILKVHDLLEEKPGGVYEVCETLTASEADDLLSKVRSAPDVPPNRYNAKPYVLEATRRALARAGYNFDDYVTPEQQ